MATVIAVTAAPGAACCFALAAVVQHSAAADTGEKLLSLRLHLRRASYGRRHRPPRRPRRTPLITRLRRQARRLPHAAAMLAPQGVLVIRLALPASSR